jgi:hypothetical protein
MYKLDTEIINQYTASLQIKADFNKTPKIKQYVGTKTLIW